MQGLVIALPYQEPGIVTILVLSSFLLLQNAISWAFDRLLYCGLVGQIAIGIAWGTPGANWLSGDVQSTIVQIGYIGLILLVFEGGLSTNIWTLKTNLILSTIVAVIGISAPIGLSFTLPGFINGVTPLQAFAAGAALCSTSLGTTFTILSTSGMSSSRLGVVISSAAMMDDIVGLVMSGIISNLGSSADFQAATVVRPILVSAAFVVVIPLCCVWIVAPATKRCFGTLSAQEIQRLLRILKTEPVVISLHTLVLVAFVASSSYAGTSLLFAAYLAGACITWWDGVCQGLSSAPARGQASNDSTPEINTPLGGASSLNARTSSGVQNGSRQRDSGDDSTGQRSGTEAVAATASPSSQMRRGSLTDIENLTGLSVFEEYIKPALQTILKPCFFASIGFAIPITQMFTGPIVWRGVVYALLMTIAKVLTGLCLVRLEFPSLPTRAGVRNVRISMSSCIPWSIRQTQEISRRDQRKAASRATANVTRQGRAKILRPTSLYPAVMLGSAMVARGEIGFLISNVAESDGVYGKRNDDEPSELFLVVTWAILLCTLIGPIVVGLMVKRVKRLQAMERRKRSGKRDPLGIWGVVEDAQRAS